SAVDGVRVCATAICCAVWSFTAFHAIAGGLSGDEMVSLGFWVGNPSAIGWHQPRIFQHPCYPYASSRQRAEESRRAVCAEKWPEAQAEQVAGVHVFSPQEGAETIPRDPMNSREVHKIWIEQCE